MPFIAITSHQTVNGLPFGATIADLERACGKADEALENYTGEWELRYGESFYRFFANQLVEATFPATCQFVINGVSILDVNRWLAEQTDTVDKAKFRISLNLGLAYDNRFSGHGSVTAFAAGRWDTLVIGN